MSPAPTQAPPHTPRRRTGFSLPAFGASLVALLALSPRAHAATPAFPGAHGFGAVTPGGRGGDVIHVTTLAPKGPGALQEALDRDTPRVGVFDVSGIIEGDIEVTHGRVTIAGQTAPGAGITIRGRLMGAGAEPVIPWCGCQSGRPREGRNPRYGTAAEPAVVISFADGDGSSRSRNRAGKGVGADRPRL